MVARCVYFVCSLPFHRRPHSAPFPVGFFFFFFPRSSSPRVRDGLIASRGCPASPADWPAGRVDLCRPGRWAPCPPRRRATDPPTSTSPGARPLPVGRGSPLRVPPPPTGGGLVAATAAHETRAAELPPPAGVAATPPPRLPPVGGAGAVRAPGARCPSAPRRPLTAPPNAPRHGGAEEGRRPLARPPLAARLAAGPAMDQRAYGRRHWRCCCHWQPPLLWAVLSPAAAADASRRRTLAAEASGRPPPPPHRRPPPDFGWRHDAHESRRRRPRAVAIEGGGVRRARPRRCPAAQTPFPGWFRLEGMGGHSGSGVDVRRGQQAQQQSRGGRRPRRRARRSLPRPPRRCGPAGRGGAPVQSSAIRAAQASRLGSL